MCPFRSFASANSCLRPLEHVDLESFPPTVAAAVAMAMMVVRPDGYDVWYLSLVGYTMNMQILGNSITSHGVFTPTVWLRLSWMVVSSELANSPCSRLQKQKSSAPLRDHRCGQVTWQVLPPLWSSHLAGKGHMGSGSGERVPLEVLPALYLSVVAPLLVQSSSATLPNLSRPQSWSSHLASAHERQAFDHRCGRVAKLALERRRVQWHCPRAPTPEPGKGHQTKNRQSQRRKVFLPGCSVFSLSWPACAWSLLVPVRGFPGPAPSGSFLFWFRQICFFLWPRASRSSSQREGRGSSAGAPTQETAQGADPRTGFCRYPSAYGFVVYLVAP